jgi:hypothetical protein
MPVPAVFIRRLFLFKKKKSKGQKGQTSRDPGQRRSAEENKWRLLEEKSLDAVERRTAVLCDAARKGESEEDGRGIYL